MAVQDEVPKSRLTLTYKTEVNGQPEDVNLPLRMLFMGDLSLGTSTDRKSDLEERRLRSINGPLDDVMKDMKMKLDFVVPNKVDPEKGGENLRVSMPVNSMKSFSPDEIIQQVPKLKGLLLLKKLLMEVQSNVANKKEFRNLLADLYANPEAFQKVMEELKEFEGMKITKDKK